MSGFLTEFGNLGLNLAKKIGRESLDFVYPQVCPECGDEMSSVESGSSLSPKFCSSCCDQLAPPIEHACSRCAAPVGPFLNTVNGCIHCKNDRFAFKGVVRLGVYDDQLRYACLQAKGTGGRPLAAALAGLLFERERIFFERAEIDLVVPIPHHWFNRMYRPHNSSTTIADVLARLLKVKFYSHILAKVRITPAQTSLTPSQRRSNLKRAFRVRQSSALSDRTVLLVDDILTTGTTADEASKMLLQAGARKVYVAVIARGLGRT